MHLTNKKQAKRLARSKRITKKLNVGRNTPNRDNQETKQTFSKPNQVNNFGTENRIRNSIAKVEKTNNGLGSKLKSLIGKIANLGD